MDEEKRENNESFEESESSQQNSSESQKKSPHKEHKKHEAHSHKKHTVHHAKKADTITLKKPQFVKSMQKNPWMAATIVLGLILLYMLYANQGTSVGTTAGVGEQKAGEIVLDLVQLQVGDATLVSTAEKNGLYEVVVNVQGQESPIYLTKDGENIIGGGVIPVETIKNTAGTGRPDGPEPTPTNIPKSAKPEVELFVMSHCPYGTQIEKGMLPVVKELQDDIDFEVKFVYYAMHPTAGEVQEQVRQYCIQEEANDKYLAYLSCFLETGGSSDTATEATSIACQEEVGIDTTAIDSCYAATDAAYDVTANLEDTSSWVSGRFPQFNVHKEENDAYGVQGSPTLVVNGQQVSSGRDAQSLLNTICGAFEEQPESCNTDMTSFGNPGPGFGFDSQGGSAAAAGCAF